MDFWNSQLWEMAASFLFRCGVEEVVGGVGHFVFGAAF
jgi:hypothetical protein